MNLLKCWEYFNCTKAKCPAYKSNDLRCWLLCGTHCHEEIQGTWLEKMEVCIKCKVFEININKKDWKDTLLLISEQFKEYKDKIKEKQKILKESQRKLQEFKITSIYLLKELDKKSEEVLVEKNNLERRVKEKTDELRNIHLKLIQSTKMAAIGRFSAGIAHEINNPLGAIINYVRTLLANPEIHDQNRGYLELTLKGLFRIENIVRQILSYSGSRKSELKLTNVSHLINDTIAFVQHKLDEKKINLELYLAKSLHSVLIDPFQIQQVFINIINNALDAIDPGGRLTIETSSNNREVEIKFNDNGKGIEEDDLEKIFDPFYTTKEVGKGTGLGLFISYNIIQIYQGTLEIKSKKGEGTQVIIKFPVPEND